MSDIGAKSGKSEDVEDVLSSIKRLVSAADHSSAGTSSDQASHAANSSHGATVSQTVDTSAKPTALLLTSALRVPPQRPDDPEALDSLRHSINQTMPDDTSSDAPVASEAEKQPAASMHWIAPEPLGEYYEDEAADDPAGGHMDEQVTEDVDKPSASEADPVYSENVLHLTPSVAPAGAIDAPSIDISEVDAFQPEDVSEQEHEEDADLSADERSAFPEADTLNADADLDPNDAEEDAHLAATEQDLQAAASDGLDADWDLDGLEGDSSDQPLSEEGSWSADASAEPYPAAAEAAAEPWDEVVTAGHAPFARETDEDDIEVSGIATFVRSGREITYTELDTQETVSQTTIEEAETLDMAAFEESEAETSDLFEDDLLDEGILRELVAEIVREELTGALGERITRNVRKLVRQEINRALAAQDLD